MAARIATDQIIDIRMTLRNSTYMFGDNESVIKSSTIPHSSLTTQHNALSYHRVREAIAGKIIRFFHIIGENNPADIVSKHWGQAQVWHLIRLLLFYSGETTEIPGEKGAEEKRVNKRRQKRNIKPFVV